MDPSATSLVSKTTEVEGGALSRTFEESESWKSETDSHKDWGGSLTKSDSNASSLAITDDRNLPDIELAIDGTPYTHRSHRKEAESACEEVEVVLSS